MKADLRIEHIKPLRRKPLSNNHDNTPLVIHGCYRLPVEQQAAYDYGRKGKNIKKKKITNAKPLRSLHNYGLAFDITIIDLKNKKPINYKDSYKYEEFVAPFAKKYGFDWGGRFGDKPHFEKIIKKFEKYSNYINYLENKYKNESKQNGYIKIG